jgi:hypothetical protein
MGTPQRAIDITLSSDKMFCFSRPVTPLPSRFSPLSRIVAGAKSRFAADFSFFRRNFFVRRKFKIAPSFFGGFKWH